MCMCYFISCSLTHSLIDKQCAPMLHIFSAMLLVVMVVLLLLFLSLLFNLLAILVDLFYNTKKFYFLLSLYRYYSMCVCVSGPIDAFIACSERRRSASVVCQIELNRFLVVCASQKYHLIFFLFQKKKKQHNKWAESLLFLLLLLLLVFFFFSFV